MTAADALREDDAEDRRTRIEAWASEVWSAWAVHHPTVRGWVDACAQQPAGRTPAEG